MPRMIDEDGVHLSHTIHVEKVTLELLKQDNEFANYLRKLIQEEFNRRMEKALMKDWEKSKDDRRQD